MSTVAEFRESYSHLPDEHLLRLSNEGDLKPEAQLALGEELAARGLAGERLEAFREETERLRREAERDLPDVIVLAYGIGKRFFGKRNRSREGASEEYDATLFFVIFWFPLLPIATYRLRRADEGRGPATVAEKLALDKSQVLAVWLVALLIATAVIKGVPLLLKLLR